MLVLENAGSGGGVGVICTPIDAEARLVSSPMLKLCVKSRSMSMEASCFSGSDGAKDRTEGGLEYSILV